MTYARRGERGASYKDDLPSLAAWQAVWDRTGRGEAGEAGGCDAGEDDGSDSDAPGLDFACDFDE